MIAFGVVPLVLGVPDVLAWLPPIVLGVSFLTGLFAVPFAWFAVRRRRDLVEQSIQLVANATGITQTTPFGQGHLAWPVFARVREIGNWFFLDTGTGASQIIPKRALSPEDLATFRKLIADAGFGMDGRRKSQKHPKT